MKFLKVAASVFGASILAVILVVAVTGGVSADEGDTIDHRIFPQLQQDFATGPEVTTACLECHSESATDIMMTTHWTWEYTTEDSQTLGKNNVINNYCVAVDSNWPRCTS